MKKQFVFIISLCLLCISQVKAIETDTIATSNGNLIIHFVGHGSLYFEVNNKIIQVDPFSKLADYATFPKADIILITHSHPDHLDSAALSKIIKESTELVFTKACSSLYTFKGKSYIMSNGDQLDISGMHIEAVPAYGINAKRPDGEFYHPKGIGNGYILTINGKRIYIAGDTENIPEMNTFKNIDIAFLPMNLPYTMTPEQMADAAKMVQPKVLYPYHYGSTDVSKLVGLLKDQKAIEVRVRDMK